MNMIETLDDVCDIALDDASATTLDDVCETGEDYYDKALSSASSRERAEANGWIVRVASPNQLFVDLDNASSCSAFFAAIARLLRADIVKTYTVQPSKSGGQHKHAYVELTKDYPVYARIAFQSMLGSDIRKELISIRRVELDDPEPIIFFEKAE